MMIRNIIIALLCCVLILFVGCKADGNGESAGADSVSTHEDGNALSVADTEGETSDMSEGAESSERTPEQTTASDILSYEAFNAMSGKEQEEFYYSFPSAAEFFDWLNAAKAEYEATTEDNRTEIDGDGNIDLSGKN